ncbi:hypothetical protein N7481_008123 [Penicillium waksmanii]|uniref:uncharacterized protein n=1 Tax=Penicillium waksmanii TaxID=69791 RepID=UPI0025479685|nr:uncharacterized protein N7481_008123 [Penicillium waksmanii]KAJ5980825.1 hypothetical protein N7481_008123 [Penicillium waksmanii]
MAKTSQTTRDSNKEPCRWIQREYIDHKGNKVILGKWVCWGRQFYQPEEFEGYRLQRFPFLEIYSYNPSDALSCVEHQRNEVAHRKRLHAERRGDEDDTILPPFDPYNATRLGDQFMSGFCFLLISRIYLQGYFRDNDHGPGPLWIGFDPSLLFGLKKLPMIKRLSSSPTKLRTFAEWGIAVNPEMIDVTTISLYADASHFAFDYGLYEPLPPSPSQDNLTSQHTREILEQQQTDDIQLEKPEYDLQYVIYVPFLADIEQERTTFLEATARKFTASIILNLSIFKPTVSKTVRFEFRIPDSSSLSYFLSAPPDGFDIGACHEFDTAPGQEMRIRALPMGQRDFCFRPFPHQYFTVILDKPSFTQEPSVLRSAGIQEVARRLAMLAVEENIQGDARTLTREEHREFLSLSLEEYE